MDTIRENALHIAVFPMGQHDVLRTSSLVGLSRHFGSTIFGSTIVPVIREFKLPCYSSSEKWDRRLGELGEKAQNHGLLYVVFRVPCPSPSLHAFAGLWLERARWFWGHGGANGCWRLDQRGERNDDDSSNQHPGRRD